MGSTLRVYLRQGKAHYITTPSPNQCRVKRKGPLVTRRLNGFTVLAKGKGAEPMDQLKGNGRGHIKTAVFFSFRSLCHRRSINV